MSQQIALLWRRASLGTKVVVLGLASVLPVLMPVATSAAPNITSRTLTSTSAQPGQATDLTWTFATTSAVANVKQIEIEFCDSPLTGCTTEDGSTNGVSDNIPILPASPAPVITGTNAFNSPAITGTPPVRNATGDAGAANNQITIVLDSAAAAASSTGSIAIPAFTNDNDANKTYYTRMRLYSDTGTTLVWEGVFAQSTSQTLTVNARVQERLDFCVGTTGVVNNNATTSVAADCTTVTGNSVDIGNIEGNNTNVSPVTATNGGDDSLGIAMVRTNAVGGVAVAYKSLLESSSGTLKVPTANCTNGVTTPAAVSNIGTDQCFNSATAQLGITAGTEKFGMTIAGINCGSTSAYSCVFSTGNYNLVRDGDYDGNASNTYVTDTNLVGGTTNAGYAWDATGAADPIASSTGSAIKVLDDEVMMLKFAATAGITTPTGSYTVQADFIATATF